MSNHSDGDAFAAPPEKRGQRYNFRVIDGDHVTDDPEGIECTNIDEVAAEAVEGLPAMMDDEVPSSGLREISVQVTDESGKVVVRATLSLRVERFD